MSEQLGHPYDPYDPEIAEHTHRNGLTHTHDYGLTPHAHQTVTVSDSLDLARFCLNPTGGLLTEPKGIANHPSYRYSWRPYGTEQNEDEQ